MCTPTTVLSQVVFKSFSLTSPIFAKKNFLIFNQNSKCVWSFTGNFIYKNTSTVNKNQERYGSASTVISTSAVPPGVLTKKQAKELAVRLTSDERQVLISALQECQSQKLKAEYEGQLAAFRWRSKFGRPSKVPSLGDVDPTGSYCAVPDDWLLRKYAETVPEPCRADLLRGSNNAMCYSIIDSFIIYSFNCTAFTYGVLVIGAQGDSIEATMGVFISLSTMAAAAFGNTISDILGIGSAYYVEQFAQKIGFQPPKLTPIQLDLPKCRRAANMGRVIGVTIGCLLGMLPLLVLRGDSKEEKNKSIENEDDKK